MQFWRGNRIDAEFSMTPAQVAAQFMEWFRAEPGSDDVIREVLPVGRLLLWWLCDKDHFNSVWEDRDGYAELEELVFRQVFEAGRA
jgi:hypothetical protein